MAVYPYNGYQTGYYGQPMPEQFSRQNQMIQQPMTAPQSQPQQTTDTGGIIWVQGEAGAKAYLVAPGQSVLLMDSEKSAFYIKSTDSSGMPLPLRIFDYTERNTSQNVPTAAPTIPNIDMANYITREEFEEKLASLTSQRKSNSRNKEENDNG